MSENKKYYWLKLKEDFFDDETIRFIEEQPNGVLYSNFYLKLCLKSLKTNGKLIRMVGETLIPYDENALARLTGVDIDTVRCAMHVLKSIGTVKILESGEIYLAQVEEMVGKETDKAVSMRRLRAENKKIGNGGVTMLPECYPTVTQALPICYPEIETRDRDKSLEIETKDRDIDKSTEKEVRGKNPPCPPKPIRHKYGEYDNVLLSDEDMQKLQKEFPGDWLARIERLSEYMASTGKPYKNHLATIRNWARKEKETAPQRRKSFAEIAREMDEEEGLV